MATPGSTSVALVTGAAKRVGKALALELGRLGYAVAVHHNSSAAEAEATAAEIRATGGRAQVLSADLLAPGAAQQLIDACRSKLGPISCLVNNASLFFYDDLASLSEAQWRQNLTINLDAPIFLAQAFARQLPAGVEGLIVNIIDQRVWRPTPEFFSYGIAKAGLWAATRMLAQALAPRIRVNAIGPGPTLQSIYQTPDEFARQAAAMPLGHGARPEDIAGALRYILEAPAMTGQMIALDGGQHLEWRMADGAPPAERHVAPQLPAETGRSRRPGDAGAPVGGIRRIFVRDLEVDAVIGVYPQEKLAPQRILISLDIAALETGEPGNDRLADVVDYDQIVGNARALAADGHVNLLETLAERIAAQTLAADERILTVRVSISKPDIYSDAKSVGIEIERSLSRR
ncbi:MAG: SDR family oxidoreductase [Hyphomicrobiaceae bacterium]